MREQFAGYERINKEIGNLHMLVTKPTSPNLFLVSGGVYRRPLSNKTVGMQLAHGKGRSANP